MASLMDLRKAPKETKQIGFTLTIVKLFALVAALGKLNSMGMAAPSPATSRDFVTIAVAL